MVFSPVGLAGPVGLVRNAVLCFVTHQSDTWERRWGERVEPEEGQNEDVLGEREGRRRGVCELEDGQAELHTTQNIHTDQQHCFECFVCSRCTPPFLSLRSPSPPPFSLRSRPLRFGHLTNASLASLTLVSSHSLHSPSPSLALLNVPIPTRFRSCF